jgi:ubiquitin carboxyl-terminal hydrolase 5/13
MLCRYYEDDKRAACKMEVLVDMQHSLNLEHLRARGPQPDERMQPSTDEAGAAAGPAPLLPCSPPQPQPSKEIVSNLAAVLPGYSKNALKRAALAVGNSDANAAMNWLLCHSEDADINNPIPAPALPPVAAEHAGIDAIAVAQLVDMGFTEKQTRVALRAGGGGTDRAVAWLFEQGDALDAVVEKMEAAVAAAELKSKPKVHPTPCASCVEISLVTRMEYQ